MKSILIKMGLFLALLHFSKSICGQTADSTKHTLHFSGTVNANSNRFSLVPTFSLGKPAVQTDFNISRNKCAPFLTKNSQWNVSEIGYAVGFSEVTHFNNFFKKMAKASPGWFRQG